MTTNPDHGGPAFPGICGEHGYGHCTRVVHGDDQVSYVEHNQGMTLRDWFAGQALTGIIAADLRDGLTATDCAASAYDIADAMLRRRAEQ